MLAQIPQTTQGKIVRIENFPSKFVSARNIDIWLPNNYTQKKKYAVVYMHDGQMLYDSTMTWNKQAWEAEEMAQKLIDETKITQCIIVGIWNSNTRHSDYFPQKPFETLSKQAQDSIYKAVRGNGQAVFSTNIHSDDYLKFLVTELKPVIDSTFATYKDRKHTFIAGSSMGGLISMYAICEYPHIFGGAACLSTHWTGIFSVENNPIPAAFMQYLKENLPSPHNHKIYFDYGTETLDALYAPFQQQVDVIMKEKGFSAQNWITQKFEGENHSENAWKKRLHIPFTFLLGSNFLGSPRFSQIKNAD